MLSAETTEISAKSAAAAEGCAPTGSPLLVSIPEARRQLGHIGTTAFYGAVKRHGIQLVRLGGRSLVPMTEIERVVALLIAERPADASEKAKALASLSVAARLARRGSTAATATTAPPSTTRRRRRGSTAP